MEYLSYLEVFVYLEATPASRNVSEGQEVLNDNHIIRIGLKSKQPNKVMIYALCLQSSSPRN